MSEDIAAVCVHDDGTEHPSDGTLPCRYIPRTGCTLDATCEFGPHAPDAHPCGQKPETPGTPCRHCGEATPIDGSPCATCWQPLDVATFKAFCGEQGWDTKVVAGRRS